ncbi:ZINC TRANSPORTER 5-LIKE [Salix purpurea]|uniref:ZINC TRANSPORTER 5-LIKE n=1 Tax=Salix purpurea TaxID=77065 RepID=A0A9Q0THW9_SALPP|nr:ZINC TRANSPORTER 5-LIKE [Salix purpurea]
MIKHQSWSWKFLTISSCLIFLMAPVMVSSKCTGIAQDNHDQNTSEAFKYKLVAICSLLFASALGVCLPFFARNVSFLHPDREAFFLVKAFAAGVILGTGFIHILPDAFESLTSPCLGQTPWEKFPFAGFVAMLSAIGVLMMESFATGYHKRFELRKPQPISGDHEEESDRDEEGASGVHVRGPTFALKRANSSDLNRHRIVSQVLELGIVVHSVIIGLSLGASKSSKTIKPLVAALSFHQFFEGIGLGGCISQAKFKLRAKAIMILFFSLTTPTGIAVGTCISRSYNATSPVALIVQGILNSASAGILIYMALVDLLATDFMNSNMLCSFWLQLGAHLALLLGAFTMSLLAIWGGN